MDTFQKSDSLPKQFCSLCSSNNNRVSTHSTFNCLAFPSTSDELAKLRSVNGCDKCGNSTHSGSYCKLKFKRTCIHCNKYHFSYLCPGENKASFNNAPPKGNLVKTDKNSGKSAEKNSSTEAKCTWINGMVFDTGHDSVLPTFTFQLGGKNIRAMRDSGCQTCFVTKKLAKKLNLKVLVEKLELSINGINSSKKILTTVVELPIFANAPPISAVCIPEIRTSLSLPGLGKVAKGFTDRGYKLADSLLEDKMKDTITNIDVIIGVNEAQLLPQTDVTFGGRNASVYTETPVGVFLLGSIDKMLKILDSLPCKLERYSGYKFDDLTALAGHVFETEPVATSLVEQQFDVIGAKGNVDETVLQRTFESVIGYNLNNFSSYDEINYEEGSVEVDKSLVGHVLQGTTRDADRKNSVSPFRNEIRAKSDAPMVVAPRPKRSAANSCNDRRASFSRRKLV